VIPFATILRATFALLLAIAMTACASTKQIEVVAITPERPKPAMPTTCYAAGSAKFKPIDKVAGNKTPAANALHALQSNKSRMARNDERALNCECWVRDEIRNPGDIKRLDGLCPGPAPDVAASAAG
jgi:hypothetical protein